MAWFDAGGDAPLEKAAFHGTAGEGTRPAEGFAGELRVSAAQFKFAQCGWIEGIGGEAVEATDGAHLFEAAFRAILLRDRNRTIESDDRRGPGGPQDVISG